MCYSYVGKRYRQSHTQNTSVNNFIGVVAINYVV